MRLIDADKMRTELFDAVWMTDNDEHMVEEIVERQPTVDAEPVRHGRWEYGITLNHEWRKCSECLVSQDIFGCFTYCPNCGAKMDGGSEK